MECIPTCVIALCHLFTHDSGSAVPMQFETDDVIFPRESSHFRFFAENSYKEVPPLNATDMYIRNTIGLRILVEHGKVSFLQVPGKHLGITREIAQAAFAPFLTV